MEMMSKIILFWSVYNKNFTDVEEWRNYTFKPSNLHLLAYQGHEKLKNNVELYTYQKCNLDYQNIKLKDANDILDYKTAYQALKNGHSIAHISDAIRIKRASEIEGIILDIDAVPLKKFPNYDSWFSTMPCKKTGGFAPKWGKNKPPMKIHDNSWSGKELTAFPVKVSYKNKNKFNTLADNIINKLKQKPKQSSDEWNSVLWTVKDIANNDTTAKVFEPIYMCPLPAWLGKNKCYSLETPTRLNGKTELFGHTLPSIEEIFDKAYCIQHFFESAFNKASTIDIAWNNLSESTLLKKEYNYIYNKKVIPYKIKPIIKNKFPIYIPSKSRADSRLTSKALEEMGIPYYIIVEQEQYDDYAQVIDKKKILILDKKYQDNYDTCDDIGNTKSKGPGAARNFAWEHSIKNGHKWHWVMDDNIKSFKRYNKNLRIKCTDATPFIVMEDFVLRYKNIAMAGPHYTMFVTDKAAHSYPPFSVNCRIYSCNLIRNDVPFRWRGRYNEDTDLSLRLLKAGYCTIQFYAFLQEKITTQVVKGGNTEAFYDKEGTLPKSKMLVQMHPDVTKLKWRYGRWPHIVDYSRFKYTNRLIKKDIPIKKGINNYGLQLVKK